MAPFKIFMFRIYLFLCNCDLIITKKNSLIKTFKSTFNILISSEICVDVHFLGRQTFPRVLHGWI